MQSRHRSLEAGSNGIHPAIRALSSNSAATKGSMSTAEHWAALASGLDSTDGTQAAAGVLWLSQLLISAAEASLQAAQGKLCCVIVFVLSMRLLFSPEAKCGACCLLQHRRTLPLVSCHVMIPGRTIARQQPACRHWQNLCTRS